MYEWLCRLRICRNGCSGMPGWGPFEDVYMGSRVNAAHACQITGPIFFNPNIWYKSPKYVFDNLITNFKLPLARRHLALTCAGTKLFFLVLANILANIRNPCPSVINVYKYRYH